jgi:hypothetical protein
LKIRINRIISTPAVSWDGGVSLLIGGFQLMNKIIDIANKVRAKQKAE